MQRLLTSGKRAADCGMRFGDLKLGVTFTHCCRGVKSPEVVSCHLAELKVPCKQLKLSYRQASMVKLKGGLKLEGSQGVSLRVGR